MTHSHDATDAARSPSGQDRPDASGEDRKAPRALTLYRVSALEAGALRGFCVIKNMSTGGAMIRTAVELSKGDPAVLVMASGKRIGGRVVWRQESLAGIAFDSPTPLSEVLARETGISPGTAGRRMPRLAITVPVRVTDALGTRTAQTCDISTHGTRLSCAEAIAIGPITLDIPGLAMKRARVLWNTNDQFGSIFDSPIELDALTTWIRVSE